MWGGNGENEVLGKWPGTKMYYNGRYTQYELAFDAMNAPEKIIFNNGNGGEGNQTKDLDFENHKTYTYYVDQPQTDTYTLAGNMTAVFGTEWDVTNTDNDMVKGEDGIWTKTYYNVEVQGGTTLEYKVVKNHSWNENWGFTYKAQTNAIYEFPGMGTATYNLVFYFTPEGELPQNGMSVYCDRFLPTGISTVAADAQDAPVYNLQGMRMKSLQKGLNIVGGKKVLK